jgi:hypothetical protein
MLFAIACFSGAAMSDAIAYNTTRIAYVHFAAQETAHFEFPVPNTIVILTTRDRITATFLSGGKIADEFGTVSPANDAVGAYFGNDFGRMTVLADSNLTLVLYVLVSVQPCDIVFLSTLSSDFFVAGGSDSNWTETRQNQRACFFHAHPGIREYFVSYANLDDLDEVSEFSPTREVRNLREYPGGRVTGDWMLYIYHPEKVKDDRFFRVSFKSMYRPIEFYEIQARFPAGAPPTVLTKSMMIEQNTGSIWRRESVWSRVGVFGRTAIVTGVIFVTVMGLMLVFEEGDGKKRTQNEGKRAWWKG